MLVNIITLHYANVITLLYVCTYVGKHVWCMYLCLYAYMY